MIRLSTLRQVLSKKSTSLVFFSPKDFRPFVPLREFNQLTINNTYNYLVANKDKINFQKNESGFIRTTLPDSVLVPGETVNPLNPGEKLRLNFWYHKQSSCGMGDESIHDHPYSFQSYIISGGYEHELYKIVPAAHKKLDSQLFFQLDKKQLWALYEAYVLKSTTPSETENMKSFKFAIDKLTKSVTYQGVVFLRLSGVETMKQGNIVNVYSGLIHRVSKYHAIPGEKTLSINIVRNLGKGVTNIFLPEQKGASVKTSREAVSPEESALATEELIELFQRCRT